MATLVASGCYWPGQVFDAGVACIPPEDPSSSHATSLPALVDRADVVALVSVAKAEHAYAQYYDGLGAARLTLRRIDVAKGALAAEVVVEDGPCPMLVAREGERLIVLLERTPDGAAFEPIRPRSAIRATAQHSLDELMREVRAVAPLDADARALFERYGWNVTAKEDVAEFDLPPAAEFASSAREIVGAAPALMGHAINEYAALSSAVGLDLRPHAGERVERLSFWLERSPPEYATGTPFGHVLIAARRLVAAWVTVFPEGGPFSVAERAAALAAPPQRPSFPPADRFPDGVNIARLYRLASATSIAYKTSDGRAGDITDSSKILAIAAALDLTLSTTQATGNAASVASTRYYLHFLFSGSHVSLEYDVASGLLAVPADGYAVRPGEPFASIVLTIPSP